MTMTDPRYVRKGSGPVLVFQHGFMSGASYWQHQIEYFSQRYDVVATNLPGYAGHQHNVVDRVTGFVDFLHDLGLDHLTISCFVQKGQSE